MFLVAVFSFSRGPDQSGVDHRGMVGVDETLECGGDLGRTQKEGTRNDLVRRTVPLLIPPFNEYV